MDKQLFYVFDEHTDYVKECTKLGMKPVKGYPFVEEFVFDGVTYKTQSVHECYSGWTITVMALPCMSYCQLINTLQKSKVYDEIVGCLGILLKDHLQKFVGYLSSRSTSNKRMHKVKKIILNELASRSEYVSLMTELLEVCR